MAGDINLFFFDGDEPHLAEIMVMIAEPSLRRHGLAKEAVILMMLYGRSAVWPCVSQRPCVMV